MDWYHEPPAWHSDGQRLQVTTAAKTDFWRKTHCGFIRDNGHFYFQPVTGDFVVEVKVTGSYAALYDQAGVMIRVDETTWMKCGIEWVDGRQHASVVVTRSYSDWSVVPLPLAPPACWFRIRWQAGDMEIAYAPAGQPYTLLRVAHLRAAETVQVGVMCASPEGAGFAVTFEALAIRSGGASGR